MTISSRTDCFSLTLTKSVPRTDKSLQTCKQTRQTTSIQKRGLTADISDCGHLEKNHLKLFLSIEGYLLSLNYFFHLHCQPSHLRSKVADQQTYFQRKFFSKQEQRKIWQQKRFDQNIYQQNRMKVKTILFLAIIYFRWNFFSLKIHLLIYFWLNGYHIFTNNCSSFSPSHFFLMTSTRL